MTCDNEEREKERDCKREQESQRWSEEQVKRMKEMEEGSEAGGNSWAEQRRKNCFVSEDHSPL